MTGENRSYREIEKELCDIWKGVLGVPVQPYDDFFDHGGDSLRVIDVVIAARRRGIPVRSSAVFRNSSPARLAESLTLGVPDVRAPVPRVLRAASGGDPGNGPVVPLAVDGTAEPLFVVLSEQYVEAEREAARTWGNGRAVYGLSLRSNSGVMPWSATIPDLAEDLLGALLEVQPRGPYLLAGVGSGAVLAFELARWLRRLGHEVARLMLVKPPALPAEPVKFDDALDRRLALVVARFGLVGDEEGERVLALLREAGWYDDDTTPGDLSRLQRIAAGLDWALSRYRPTAHDGPLVLLADERDAGSAGLAWSRLASDVRAHRFDYGLDWFGPLVADPGVTDVMKSELVK